MNDRSDDPLKGSDLDRHERMCYWRWGALAVVLSGIVSYGISRVDGINTRINDTNERLTTQVGRIDNLTNQVSATQVQQQATVEALSKLLREIDCMLYTKDRNAQCIPR